MEDHLFLAVHDSLLNMFACILHTWKLSHLSATWMTRLAVVTRTHWAQNTQIFFFFKKITSLEWDIIIYNNKNSQWLSFMNQCLTAPLYAVVESRSPPPVCSSCVSSLHRTGARLLHSMPLRHVCSPAGLVTLPHLRNQAYLHAHIDICGGLGVKGKAVPLQALSGPEGSRKLGFPDYMTRAQDGGKVGGLTRRPPLPPRKCSWYSFLLEAESTPGP